MRFQKTPFSFQELPVDFDHPNDEKFPLANDQTEENHRNDQPRFFSFKFGLAVSRRYDTLGAAIPLQEHRLDKVNSAKLVTRHSSN